MNKLSFIIFCIEFYSEHIKSDSCEVFTVFKSSELLSLLDKNYIELSAMSKKELMQFFDEYLSNAVLPLTIKNSFVSSHTALIIPGVVRLISERFNFSDLDAMDAFYASNIARALGDPTSGYYEESSFSIFSGFLKEINAEK